MTAETESTTRSNISKLNEPKVHELSPSRAYLRHNLPTPINVHFTSHKAPFFSYADHDSFCVVTLTRSIEKPGVLRAATYLREKCWSKEQYQIMSSGLIS